MLAEVLKDFPVAKRRSESSFLSAAALLGEVRGSVRAGRGAVCAAGAPLAKARQWAEGGKGEGEAWLGGAPLGQLLSLSMQKAFYSWLAKEALYAPWGLGSRFSSLSPGQSVSLLLCGL